MIFILLKSEYFEQKCGLGLIMLPLVVHRLTNQYFYINNFNFTLKTYWVSVNGYAKKNNDKVEVSISK